MIIKYIRKKILYFTVFILCTYSTFCASYTIKSLSVNVLVHPTGELQVTETVTYNAGQLNGIIEDIDYGGFGQILLHSVLVQTDPSQPEAWGKTYKDNEGNTYLMATQEYSGQFGTYEATDYNVNGILSVRVYAKTMNRSRKFIFNYTLPYGVELYDDIARLNRKFVGKEWDNIDDVTVTVKFANQLNDKDLRVFAHGPVTGEVDIIDKQTIAFKLKKYYTGDFVEGDILFPRNYITNKNYQGPVYNEKGLEKILAMEEKLANETNRKRTIAKVIYYMFYVGIGIWLVLLIAIKIVGSKKHRGVAPYGKYFRELPDDYTPAVAGALIEDSMYPDETQLFASVLDLVRKKYLKMDTISQSPKKTKLALIETADVSLLNDYERYVLDWYIKELGDGKEVILEDIQNDISKNVPRATKFSKSMDKWEDMVCDDMISHQLTYEKYRPFLKKMALPTAFIYMAIGILGLKNSSTYLGNASLLYLVYVPLGMVMLMASKAKLRPTQTRADAVSRWEAFKNYIVDYSRLEESKLPDIILWEHYFVYAVALGVAKKVAEQFEKVLKNLPEEQREGMISSSPMIYQIYNNGYRDSFSPLMKATDSNVAQKTVQRDYERRNAARSRSSSSGGFGGGGFSGGSSGGGGGGGGGRGF